MNLAHHGDWLIRGGKGPPLRNLDVSLDAVAARVSLVGEIDIAEAEALRKLLTEAVSELRELEVDLRGVRFIDSAGCHALVRVAQHARAVGGRIRVRTVDGPVRRVFRLLQIEQILGAVEDPPAG
ncbi:MAG: anti-sigma factor antagonist [Miltoncostaeaceae bacterium]|jgi:anti-sigma B factor antagonist|nr:anti-sigma factor antagonist [Miltoncostaeaceae bacterium]